MAATAAVGMLVDTELARHLLVGMIILHLTDHVAFPRRQAQTAGDNRFIGFGLPRSGTIRRMGRAAGGQMEIAFGGTPISHRIDAIGIAEDGLSVHDVIEMPLPMGSDRFRPPVLGPDWALYAAIDEGDIFRMEPEIPEAAAPGGAAAPATDHLSANALAAEGSRDVAEQSWNWSMHGC